MKELREFGCGWYLLVVSIVSLTAIPLLGVKVCFLLLSQMALIHSRSVLYVLCLVTDPTLRALITSTDWLSACVAIERWVIVQKGIAFNRAKSQSIAKRVIPIVICLNFATHSHDFVYRKLIDDYDANEQRTWCFTRYSPFLD
ncbi:unnamed protein product [Rotaria magnacalcarata]|uniref:Uncharacterized protein n=2 Tax=Rotaria magnacalcarata TaxID=392030 RepID=A0A816A2G6_9BILA|nr:unnamed protein product [Rotaria magnacalcarata]CAF1592473.1 unnamed protein product [Rotaria magnacalcarata]CAF4133124.1 unnamed protein product [Rotaria magnacalcarata]CAF4230656.1 unnamed protein product [Rotaria magnacalcarata]